MKKHYIMAFGGLLLFAVILLALRGGKEDARPRPAEDRAAIEAVGYNPSATAQIAEATRRLLGRRPLKEYHLKVHQNGVSCQLCHSGDSPVGPPDDANCIRCHGTPYQMAQLTAKLERNPHKSPHYGVHAPCITCHKEHQPSRVLCYDCHTFTYENFKK